MFTPLRRHWRLYDAGVGCHTPLLNDSTLPTVPVPLTTGAVVLDGGMALPRPKLIAAAIWALGTLPPLALLTTSSAALLKLVCAAPSRVPAGGVSIVASWVVASGPR